MEFVIIFLVTFFAGLNIFLSGFGLAITVTSAFLFFFPLGIAIPLTALVHFLGNLVKFLKDYKKVNREKALKFGIPSVIAAVVGAFAFVYMSSLPAILQYNLSEEEYSIFPFKLIFSMLMLFFVFFELLSKTQITFWKNTNIVAGALLSGFFGGLIGNQGVIRAIFLKRAGLTKDTLIATGVLVASFVDIARLFVYFPFQFNENMFPEIPLMATAVLSAFLGFVLGDQLLRNSFHEGMQKLTASFFVVIAFCVAFGIL